MAEYSVQIAESSKELSARDKIRLKDTTGAQQLNKLAKNGEIIITPVAYTVLDVHNDKAQGDKDYKQYLIEDADGTIYTTGSSSLWNAFKDIFDELTSAGEEGWSIKVYGLPSKNYEDKIFLTCSLI